jgi:hypothetical protein
MTDKMRSDFEAEILKNRAAFMLTKVASGEYQSGTTQELWKYWQAATLVERESCALVCEGLVYALDHAGNKYRREAPASKCAAAIRSGGAV